MSLFEGYQRLDDKKSGTQKQNQSKLFEGYQRLDLQNETSETSQQNLDEGFWMDFAKTVLRDGVKPALKGLAAIPDFAVALGNVGLTAVNKATGADIPLGDYPSDYISKGVDYATGGLSKGDPGVIGKGIEFATGMAGGGAVAKTLTAGSKVAPWLGSTKAGDVATAGAMGATTKLAEDAGADPLTAAGVGLLGPLGVQKAAVKAYEKTVPALPIMSQQAKHFNLEAYDAAQREGIQLPLAAADKSPFTKVSDTAGKHSIVAANMLEKENEQVKQSFKNALERNLDKTSRKNTLENQKLRDLLYKDSKGILTDKDVIQPTETLKSFEAAKQSLTENALTPTKKEKEYIQQLDKLQNSLLGVKVSQLLGKDGQSINLADYKRLQSQGDVPVKKLIEQKQRLNNQINKLPQDEWALKDELIKVRDALKSDIDTYAQNNPAFGEKWSQAEKLHAEMAKRQDLNDMLKLKEQLHPEIDFDPKKVAENYLNVRNDKQFIKLIGGKENLKHFDDIATAAQSLPHSNVSNLAKNMKIMALLGTGASAITGLLVGGAGAATGIAGSLAGVLAIDYGVGKYLTNPQALAKIAQYARKPTPENAKIVNNTFKKEFGESVDQVNTKFANFINQLSDSDKAKLGLVATQAVAKNQEDKGYNKV